MAIEQMDKTLSNNNHHENDSSTVDPGAVTTWSPSLYLSGGSLEWSWNPLDIVSTLFMLPVYGSSALVRRTLYELRIAAWLLLLVFFFDWAAWFMVFNHLAHPNGLTFQGYGSMFALGAALMIATAMVMLERSIMVSDTQNVGGKGSFHLRVAARFAIILISAFITSQPVELVAFKSSIDERIFQEDIRRNMVEAADRLADRRTQDYERLSNITVDSNASKTPNADVDPSSSFSDSDSAQQVPSTSAGKQTIRDQVDQIQINQKIAEERKKRIEQQVREKHAAKSPLEAQRSTAEKNLAAARETERTAMARGATPDELKSPSEDVRRAQTELSRVKSKIDALTSEISRLQTKSSFLADQSVGLSKQAEIIGTKAQDFETFQKDYRTFVAELKKARAAKDIPPVGEFSFVQREYGDVEKLGIIIDLMTGRPPHWPEFAVDTRVLMNNDNIQTMKELDARNAQENHHLLWITRVKYLSFLLIAILIPGVALIYKITATGDLTSYFSSSYQAARLLPEALEHEVTRETMRRKRAVVGRPIHDFDDD
ncbi:MAG TPA: hypothetical protein VNZ47_05185 [Candidatus Dormibacteraeota bacterium]|jgi:hypothetical protein|nr:hypothetical protein [Candidatus Dormibacteraeota bacterium]